MSFSGSSVSLFYFDGVEATDATTIIAPETRVSGFLVMASICDVAFKLTKFSQLLIKALPDVQDFPMEAHQSLLVQIHIYGCELSKECCVDKLLIGRRELSKRGMRSRGGNSVAKTDGVVSHYFGGQVQNVIEA